MNIQIGLAIIQIDLLKNSPPFILSTNPDNFQLPVIDFYKYKYRHEEFMDAVKELSKQCVDLSVSWIHFELVDLILNKVGIENEKYETTYDDNLVIVYGCIVPFSTNILDNHWVETKIENSQEFNLAIKTLKILGNFNQ